MEGVWEAEKNILPKRMIGYRVNDQSNKAIFHLFLS